MKKVFILLFTAGMMAAPAFAQKQFKVVNTVKLGGEGGWDYLTFDKDGQRLFITRGTTSWWWMPSTLKATATFPVYPASTAWRWLRS